MGAGLGRRIIESLVATVLLLVCLPVIAIMAFGAAISLRTWPFFTHTRVGRDGELFRVIKLRTLPRATARYAAKDEIEAVRVTRFGRLLRDAHLDELPQLLLVITGKMSLVGPRPEMPHLVSRFDHEFAGVRASVRPGCTGLWQIGEHRELLILEHPEYDNFYVRQRSVRLDLWILARTTMLMLPFHGDRGVSLADVPPWALRSATETPRPAELQSAEAA